MRIPPLLLGLAFGALICYVRLPWCRGHVLSAAPAEFPGNGFQSVTSHVSEPSRMSSLVEPSDICSLGQYLTATPQGELSSQALSEFLTHRIYEEKKMIVLHFHI